MAANFIIHFGSCKGQILDRLQDNGYMTVQVPVSIFFCLSIHCVAHLWEEMLIFYGCPRKDRYVLVFL